MSEHGNDDGGAVAAPDPADRQAGGETSTAGERVSSDYTPGLTAAYRDEVQALLHSLFGEFLRAQEPRLHDVLQSARALDAHEGTLLVKALQSIGIRFQLTAIAGEIAASRKVRLVEASEGPDAVIGSFHRALARAAERGVDGAELADALATLDVAPTITAHPTEAKRVTILEIHRRIYRTLVELETNRRTPRGRERLIEELRDAIAVLWMTGELRLERPTLDEEISWGLHFFNETLVDGTRDVGETLGDAVRRHFPDAGIELPDFLRFRSLIGGDRDGNPAVTTDVTRRTLARHRDNMLRRHVAEIERLVRRLSISEHVSAPDALFRERLAACLRATGRAEEIIGRNPHEPFRQFCVAVAIRLEANLEAGDGAATPYDDPEAFADDLASLERGLRAIGAEGVATNDVAPLRRLVASFGFRTAALDIRQNADVIARTVRALGGPSGGDGGTASDVDGRDTSGVELDEEAADTVALFELLGEPQPDPDAIGAFVLAMTSSADDVRRTAWLAATTAGPGAKGADATFPPIVPLFESVDGLRDAPAILDELLAEASSRAALTDRAGVVEVMLGYSEVGKDGGYLASVQELHEAQRRIVAVSERHDVPLRFLHGRGGSVSQGGAPTGRAIAAQPPGSVRSRLRVVEKGEAISAKYSNRGTARTHLELLGAGVLNHTLARAAGESARTTDGTGDTMQALSDASRTAYRELIEMPGFLDYFLAASPVEELSLLRGGSPSSARAGALAVEDLRAIPWMFAWTQNRHHLSGWYGVGSALEARIATDGVEALQAMFADSKVFRLVLNEVEKTLHQSDMAIAARYAGLVEDRAIRRAVFERISAEHDLTVKHVLAITGEDTIAERFPGMRRRVAEAAPLIDRCNAWQVGLLRDYRADPTQGWSRVPLLLSMHCIATGLGWTG